METSNYKRITRVERALVAILEYLEAERRRTGQDRELVEWRRVQHATLALREDVELLR